MKSKAKLRSYLRSSTASLLNAQDQVKQPSNKEKLIQAELLVRCVMLSECPETKTAKEGRHGG
jgi:hypothetical protein